jgi:hypothetical protein
MTKLVKFRVWDTARQAMYNPQGITFDIKSPSPFAVKISGRSWEPSNKFEFLQWTGLSDNREVDVYEGDLVRVSSVIYKVVWNMARAAFELEELDGTSTRSIGDVINGRIVGNQYQGSML